MGSTSATVKPTTKPAERKSQMKHATIVILNDGETWTIVDGCSLAVITDADLQELENGTKEAKDLRPIMEIALRDVTL